MQSLLQPCRCCSSVKAATGITKTDEYGYLSIKLEPKQVAEEKKNDIEAIIVLEVPEN